MVLTGVEVHYRRKQAATINLCAAIFLLQLFLARVTAHASANLELSAIFCLRIVMCSCTICAATTQATSKQFRQTIPGATRCQEHASIMQP